MSALSQRIAQAIHRTAQHAIVLSLEGRHAEAVQELLRLLQDSEYTETAIDLQVLLAKVLAHKAREAHYTQAEVAEALSAFKLALLMSPSLAVLHSVTLLSAVSRDEIQMTQSTLDRKALLRNLIEDKRGCEAWEELDLFVREPPFNEEDLVQCTEILSTDELKHLRISLVVHSLGGRRLFPEALKDLLEVSPIADEVKVEIDSSLPGTLTATEWVLHYEDDTVSPGPDSLLMRPSGFVQMGWEEFFQLQLLQAACTVTLVQRSFSCELASSRGKIEGKLTHSDMISMNFVPLRRPLKRVYYKPISVLERGAIAVKGFVSDTLVKQEFDLAEYSEELLEELPSGSTTSLHKTCYDSIVTNLNLYALLMQRPTDYAGFLLLKLPDVDVVSAAASVQQAAFVADLLKLFESLSSRNQCDTSKLFEYLGVWLSMQLKGIEEAESTDLIVLAYILATALTLGERGVTELLDSLFVTRTREQRKAALALCCDNFQMQSLKTKRNLYRLLQYPNSLEELSRELKKAARDVAWLEFN